MKPSTILAALLPALTLAGTVKAAVAQEPPIPIGPIIPDPIVVDKILEKLSRSIELIDGLEVADHLITCLRNHKDFEADFSKADYGMFSITNVDPTCCYTAMHLYSLLPSGKYGNAVFAEPCNAAVITRLNQESIMILRNFFEEIDLDDVSVDGEK